MSPVGKVSLLAGIVLIGLVCALELWHGYRGDSLLARGQLIRRLLVGFMLQFAMAMMLLGETLTGTMRPQYQLIYWGICMIAVIIPLLVAVREIRVVGRQYAQRRAELFRDMARSEPHDRRPSQPG